MPRKLSSDTELIYWWLWRWPWASARDIAGVTGMSTRAVSNALKRGRDRGWFLSARLGRVFDAVDRYVPSNEGVRELHQRFGWPVSWWHTANAVRALARRLEVLEMAYRYLPSFWQSNMITEPTVNVYGEMPYTSADGARSSRMELVPLNWYRAHLVDFRWLESGPLEAIASYSTGGGADGTLLLPVLWRGNFMKPADISRVRRDMEKVLVEDERRSKLPLSQAVGGIYGPGAVVFCPDRVSAAMVQRHWLESEASSQYSWTTLAIIDAQGQVVRAMDPPTSWWANVRPPSVARDLKDIGDIGEKVETLGRGAYAAVNGRRPWQTFRAVDGSPGVTRDQIAESLGVTVRDARKLLDPMTRSMVITVKSGGSYLGIPGRDLLAGSQRRTQARVKRRWGVYETTGGEYTRAQRFHNQGQAEAILALRRHGFPAFPTMGVVIDYRRHGQLVRVAPDGFVVLPPDVLAALEFERSAKSPKQVEAKAKKYRRLVELGVPVPVLFVTDTDPGRGRKQLSPKEAEKRSRQAAQNLAALRCPMLLSTTLEDLRNGPRQRGDEPARRDLSHGSKRVPRQRGEPASPTARQDTKWRRCMTTKAQADHVIAEIRTNYRRHQELAGVADGSLAADPAFGQNGSPVDSGHQLDTPEKIGEANRELVDWVDSYAVWHVHIGFRASRDVKITATIRDDEVTEATLHTLTPGEGWDGEELDDTDREAIAWMLDELGRNPAHRPAPAQE